MVGLPALAGVRSGGGRSAPALIERRRRIERAELCMQEAAIGTWCVSGLALCLHVMAADVGFGYMVSFDATRSVVWCTLGVGVFKGRMLPALLLLGDLVARTAWQVGIGDPPFLPAVAGVAALLVRALFAGADAADE